MPHWMRKIFITEVARLRERLASAAVFLALLAVTFILTTVLRILSWSSRSRPGLPLRSFSWKCFPTGMLSQRSLPAILRAASLKLTLAIACV